MPESQTSVELPVLDIGQSRLLDPSDHSPLLLACKEWGFFHITNHGISMNLFKKLKSFTNTLFCLPSVTKLKAGPSSSLRTYTPHFIASPFFESFRVSGPDFLTSARSSAEVVFDHPNSEFSEVFQEYCTKMSQISKRIIEIILMSLGNDLVKRLYDSEFSNCNGYLRINNYSPPETTETEVEGLGMHTDMSCITIVYQDDIGGLQVRSKEGKWMDINPREGALVVNIGDLMHAWSNGNLRSSEHRVVLKQQLVNRLSLAFFWCFEDEKEIISPNEVVGEGNLRIYQPFVCADYLKFRESNEKGKFEKVGFTVKDFAGIGECKELP